MFKTFKKLNWLIFAFAVFCVATTASAMMPSNDRRQANKVKVAKPAHMPINTPAVRKQAGHHQKLPPPPKAGAGNAGSPPKVPVRRAPVNTPAAGNPGSPHQKLPPPPKAGNAGSPSKVPVRRAPVNTLAAGNPGSPHQKLPPPPKAGNAGSPPKVPVRRRTNVAASSDNGVANGNLEPRVKRPPLIRRKAIDFRDMNTNQGRTLVFGTKLVNQFVRSKSVNKIKGMERNKYGEWIPKGNQAGLGKFIGGGYNSRVYLDQRDPRIVHKLVPLVSFNKAGGRVADLGREVSITDQLGGRAMLKRFKAAYKGKGLGDMVQIAEMKGKPTVWNVIGPNGNTHKFAHTAEQNISSPVFQRSRNGKLTPVIGDNGEPVLATNAYERVLLRAKNKVRSERKDLNLKLKDILPPGSQPKKGKVVLTSKDLNNVITQREELTISTVIRGLNHNGIVWTDHKLQNMDIVRSQKSKTGYKVVFFDFDAMRVVKGETRQDRKVIARRLQTGFDHATREKPFNVSSEAFDFTAFGGKSIGTLSSPGANRFRSKLDELDRRTGDQFNTILNRATKGQLRTTSPNI